MIPEYLVNLFTFTNVKRFAVSLLIIWVTQSLLARRTHTKIVAKAQKKRKERDIQISKEFTPFTAIDENIRYLILRSTATQLITLLNEDKITSEQILKVYHSRAITIGLEHELIAESNYPEALKLAQEYDSIRKKTPQNERHKLGNMFGIPISIKDSFNMKGLDSTCGIACRTYRPCKEDGAVIKIIKEQGLIPFIRTNVPQILASLSCYNRIWGRALNPWDKSRVTGGSSGGEGGLVSARCSPIGLGSDGVGSVRIPAAYHGLCGYKPTRGRFTGRGHSVVGPYSYGKFTIINEAMGPIAQSVDDCVLFMKSMITENNHKYDPATIMVPWNEEKFLSNKKMKIAYVMSEELIGVTKTQRRAIEETVQALKNLGHELVKVNIPGFEELCYLTIRVLTADGKSRGNVTILEGEEPIPEMKATSNLSKAPSFLRWILKKVLGLKGEKRLATLMDYTGDCMTYEYFEAVQRLFLIRNDILKFWIDNEFDAMITPALAPPFQHGGAEGFFSCYFWPANIANLSAGVVPVTTVREGEDIVDHEDIPHKDGLFTKVQEGLKGSVGLPICVHVMTLPWEDEKCLNIMKTIEGIFNFHPFPNV